MYRYVRCVCDVYVVFDYLLHFMVIKRGYSYFLILGNGVWGAGATERGGAGEWREVKICHWDIGKWEETFGGNARYWTGR